MISAFFAIVPRNEENHLENQGGFELDFFPLDTFKTHTLPTPPSVRFAWCTFQYTTRHVLQMGFPVRHLVEVHHTTFNRWQFSSDSEESLLRA